jgi:predicted transposase YbfD/YdcC
MDVKAPRGLLRIFSQVEDPRMDRTKKHSLVDILVITLCAVICGADSWAEIELFGQSRLDWLRTFLGLPNGIPSHDTFGRVFSRLKPDQLERCFMEFMKGLAQASGGSLLALDGKTLRNSFDRAGDKAAIHMVSAWCETNRMVLGQIATKEKSNEITAIPKLLALLDLTDTVVTIDAMGCQKKIAEQIVQQNGHYILQVKENQPGLHEVVSGTMTELIDQRVPGQAAAFHQEVDAGHGRVETRRIWTTEWTDWYAERPDWAGLTTFICVERERVVGEQSSRQRSYYMSDLTKVSPERMLKHIRGHWGIENRLHWCLDVAFAEDGLRQRKGHSAENASRMRRLALNLLRNEKSCKAGLKGKRLKAALNESYLLKILSCGVD